MTILTMRYDMRVPSIAKGSAADRYAAAVEQCAWAEENGFQMCSLAEHHGVEDGFLPSPLILAAAIAGRTKKMSLIISALLMPFHDPLRVAEDLAVLALLAPGRVSVVAGLGYRDEEFEFFGFDRKERAARLEECVEVCRKAWTGEEFEFRGHRARVTPAPTVPPFFMYGGSTELAARRAARLKMAFMPAVGDRTLGEYYMEQCKANGWDGGFAMVPSGPGFVHVTEDPEKAWAELAPYALHEATSYASWQQPGQRSQVHVHGSDLDDVKASGVYRVVTPDECVALAEELGPFGALVFHPLMGGMDIDLGWESLHLFADKVLPRLSK